MTKYGTREFVEISQRTHTQKYDYSKVRYLGSDKKVCIICPVHGEFWQVAASHLSGCDCPKCATENKKNLIYGLGINDSNEVTRTHSYRSWYNLFVRCYDYKSMHKRPTYDGCCVSREWQKYSNFKKWYDKNYVRGWCLDKDLLVPGNKEYHPDKCCYLPNEINVFLANKRMHGNNSQPGVYLTKSGNYAVNVCGKRVGTYLCIDQAINAYNEHRRKKALELADKWKEQLDPRAYNALCNIDKNQRKIELK